MTGKKAKLEFIRAFFDDIDQRNLRLQRLSELSFPEEAIILACCYIESLASFRYHKEYAGRQEFIRIIYEFSGHRTDFDKISWINLYKTGKACSSKEAEGKPILGYEQIKAELLGLYGKHCDHRREMNKLALIDYLKSRGLKLDWMNVEANLDYFSYAAVLYERYRSRGVHRGRIATKWDYTGRPVFGKSHSGDDVYYDGNILYFSKEIIFDVLANISRTLRTMCMAEQNFPHEL
jgi:hypothetical protein